mmetsp:Transcript_67305/g.156256  ORF Transcript_67305/g.156256 Transcript_67305/m.156256 type:complete len:205 (+) Transcript_67305:428-1042(+)
MRVAVLAISRAPSQESSGASSRGAREATSGLPMEGLFVSITGFALKGPRACDCSMWRRCFTNGSAEMSVECLAGSPTLGATGSPRLSSMMALAWSSKTFGLPASPTSPPSSRRRLFWNCANVSRPDAASTDKSKRAAAGVRWMPCKAERACASCCRFSSLRIAAEKSSCTEGFSSSGPSDPPPPKIRLWDVVGPPRCMVCTPPP